MFHKRISSFSRDRSPVMSACGLAQAFRHVAPEAAGAWRADGAGATEAAAITLTAALASGAELNQLFLEARAMARARPRAHAPLLLLLLLRGSCSRGSPRCAGPDARDWWRVGRARCCAVAAGGGPGGARGCGGRARGHDLGRGRRSGGAARARVTGCTGRGALACLPRALLRACAVVGTSGNAG